MDATATRASGRSSLFIDLQELTTLTPVATLPSRNFENLFVLPGLVSSYFSHLSLFLARSLVFKTNQYLIFIIIPYYIYYLFDTLILSSVDFVAEGWPPSLIFILLILLFFIYLHNVHLIRISSHGDLHHHGEPSAHDHSRARLEDLPPKHRGRQSRCRPGLEDKRW